MKGWVYILTQNLDVVFWKYSQALFGLRQVEQGFLNFVFRKQLKYLMMIIESRTLQLLQITYKNCQICQKFV